VLEYSPLGGKFLLITAPGTLYTVKKIKKFQNFFVLKVFVCQSNFDAKIFWDIFKNI
jgi:hypothetical protein